MSTFVDIFICASPAVATLHERIFAMATSISNAVGSERVGKVVGYNVKAGNFSETSPNLPMRIAVLAEANEAQQAAADNNPKQIYTAREAGETWGYGSPIYTIARILFPPLGGGLVGGIPVIVYPQPKAVGAAARVQTITVTGTATKNGTHKIWIDGRSNIDGAAYDVNIVTGDTDAVIAGKIEDAINNVLGAPVSASATDEVVTATNKWNGLTGQAVKIVMDTNGQSLGVTYAVAQTAAGSGTPAVTTALAKFGAQWNTIVVNSYGTDTTTMDALEAFNGSPVPASATGRYEGTIFKPFVAITGSVSQDPSSVTDSRKDQLTIAIAPAPGSDGLAMEAAANMAALLCRQAQDTPHLDVSGQSYPDMPAPTSITTMSTYDGRDGIVKKGCSTVDLVDSKYRVEDFVTTYHPLGEQPPLWRYVRSLIIDWNWRFTYLLKEQQHVVDHVIAGDNDVVSASKIIKPKMWAGVLDKMFKEMVDRALGTDAEFSKKSRKVQISPTNPARFETFFRYKRTEMARQLPTTTEVGFQTGS